MSDPDPSEKDLRDAEPVALVKLAAALQAISGLFVALCGLQLVGASWRIAILGIVPYLMMSAGVLQIVVGAQYYRARTWAAYAGTGLGLAIGLGMGVWAPFSFVSGVFSCLVLIATPIAVLAAVLAIVGIGGVRRTADARQRLADQGMSLGL